jgi:phage shock protein E
MQNRMKLWMLGAVCALQAFLAAACGAMPAGLETVTAAPTTAATGTATADPAPGTYRTITAAAARDWLLRDSQVLLLDVRTQEEYQAGRIAGSKLLPYDEIASRQPELPADHSVPIIVYCRTGRRSEIAARELLQLGYTAVYDLGGIGSWPYPTVKD